MFMILSLPRSRSAWLAHYLTFGSRRCGHDIALVSDSIREFLGAYNQGMWGTCETGAVVAWRLIRHLAPDLRLVTIRRPLIQVVRSLEARGWSPRLDELAQREAALDELSAQPGVQSLAFEDLQDPAACGWLFEYCLELEWDPEWYAKCSILNIQIDLAARARQIIAREAEIAGLMMEVQEETRRLGLSHGLH